MTENRLLEINENFGSNESKYGNATVFISKRRLCFPERICLFHIITLNKKLDNMVNDEA